LAASPRTGGRQAQIGMMTARRVPGADPATQKGFAGLPQATGHGTAIA
jgi:hypothetical protein